jgi:hypothetical protein
VAKLWFSNTIFMRAFPSRRLVPAKLPSVPTPRLVYGK